MRYFLCSVPNDIQLIIYRYLHRIYYGLVVKQYNEQFVPEWNEMWSIFHGPNYGFANRPLHALNYSGVDISRIHRHHARFVVAPLPINYIHSTVWWPIHATHVRLPYHMQNRLIL